MAVLISASTSCMDLRIYGREMHAATVHSLCYDAISGTPYVLVESQPGVDPLPPVIEHGHVDLGERGLIPFNEFVAGMAKIGDLS